MDDPKSYDTVSAVIFLVGVYEGLLPFVATVFDWSPFLSFPLRLEAPAWWIVSGIVLIAAVVALGWIDRAKKRRFGTRG